MAALELLTFLFLVCKVQSQIFGPYGPGLYPGSYGIDPGPCGPCAEVYGPFDRIGCADPFGMPVLPNFNAASPCAAPYQPVLNTIPSLIQNQIPYPINQPLISTPACSQPVVNIPQLAPSIITNPVPQCASTPVVATTIVDNTLANSLANAIQLLIVSNLIENTLGSSCGNSLGNNIVQGLGFLDGPCVNNYEVVCPEIYQTPIVTCEYPVVEPCDIHCYQEPVVYQPSCLDLNPCAPTFGPSIPFLGDYNSFNGYNCGCNQLNSFDSCLNPFGSAFNCEPAVATIAPMAVEVPFPASIPANLICNFGYLPNNVPCVSVNVDPLPCNNLLSNFGGFGY